ncbi:MAG: PQQ-dependent sugar dehydrogenase [Phycisphaerales bacterium]|nr:PQQ-dependent sugar dehydrogenase [Phycisphaerales bacterium]
MKTIVMLAVLGLAASLAPAGDTSTAIPRIRPVKTFKSVKLRRPVQIVFHKGEPEKLYVLEQPGNIVTLDLTQPDSSEKTIFMNLKDGVRMQNNEEGLLSMAFSPNVEEDNAFYLYYTASNPRRMVLSRFKIVDGKGDPNSEEVLLEIPQPYGNHNGGTVLFGPDEMLYLSIGDGGAANDPHGHGQNLKTLLGTVIRIDPSSSTAERPYGIPEDNPFTKVDGARPEIWAFGLRNIWRMHFDRKTGTLWAGDVGQNRWEEIDIIEKGGNYGWKLREGKHRFSRGEAPAEYPPIDPIVEYPRSDGISVTGGYVYRGTARPKLEGVYVYADYQSGRIWGIRAEDGKLVEGPSQIARLRNSLISSFGESPEGELFICSFEEEEYPGYGEIWRFTSSPPPAFEKVDE